MNSGICVCGTILLLPDFTSHTKCILQMGLLFKQDTGPYKNWWSEDWLSSFGSRNALLVKNQSLVRYSDILIGCRWVFISRIWCQEIYHLLRWEEWCHRILLWAVRLLFDLHVRPSILIQNYSTTYSTQFSRVEYYSDVWDQLLFWLAWYAHYETEAKVAKLNYKCRIPSTWSSRHTWYTCIRLSKAHKKMHVFHLPSSNLIYLSGTPSRSLMQAFQKTIHQLIQALADNLQYFSRNHGQANNTLVESIVWSCIVSASFKYLRSLWCPHTNTQK